MNYTIKRSGKFKKNYKLAQKRGLDVNLLKDIILKLGNGIPLEEKYKDHLLKEIGMDSGNVTYSLIGC